MLVLFITLMEFVLHEFLDPIIYMFVIIEFFMSDLHFSMEAVMITLTSLSVSTGGTCNYFRSTTIYLFPYYVPVIYSIVRP